jgi:branched-chain amino acid transport system substrate-binding protein
MGDNTFEWSRRQAGSDYRHNGPALVFGHRQRERGQMVIDDINANGGLLGRQIHLCLEDSATTDSIAEAKAK